MLVDCAPFTGVAVRGRHAREPPGPALGRWIRPSTGAPPDEDGEMSKKSSQWEDTAFFIGTLLLTTGGGLMIQAGLDLPPLYAKLVWGGVCLVWGAVLIRVWVMREEKR